jgi:predicted nuclease of predicted toxin-antitoxin system
VDEHVAVEERGLAGEVGDRLVAVELAAALGARVVELRDEPVEQLDVGVDLLADARRVGRIVLLAAREERVVVARDVLARRVVMRGAPPRVLQLGVSDETAWQVGLACGGKVEVWVEGVVA